MVWTEIGTAKKDMWTPEKEGDELVGKVTDIKEGKFGKQYVITNEDGVLITPSHKVLQARLAECKVGDKVKIVYNGKVPPAVRGQNAMEMYAVFVDK